MDLNREWIRIVDLKRELGVTRQTVYNWKKKYGWTVDADGRLRAADVRVAKVLRRSDVHRLDVAEEVLAAAERAKTVAPSDAGLFSLDDVARMLAPVGISAAPAERRDRQAAIDRYIAEAQRPCDLPAWFWEMSEEPRFVAPTGIAHMVCEAHEINEKGQPVTRVRSSGFRLSDGTYTGPSSAVWPRHLPLGSYERRYPRDRAEENPTSL